MKINPVLENEIRRNMRSMKVSWMIFGGNLLLTLVAVVTCFGTGAGRDYMAAAQYRFPVQCYMIMAYVLFILICLLVPGIAIAIERERRTLDILLTTHLSPWKIIVGKLEASLCVIFMLACSALPVISLVLIYGGISLTDLLALVAILVICGIFIGSIGVFCSAICRKTTVATILSYVIVLFLALGTIALVAVIYYVLGVQAERMEIYQAPDVGGWIYLLYLNPLVTFYGLLSHQVGSGSELINVCCCFGDFAQDPGVRHMLPAAIAVQLLLSVILLIIAGRRINPLRR